MEIGWNLAAVMGGLLLFGIGYNAFVAWLEREGHHEGIMSLLVGGGTLVTVAAASLIVGLEAAIKVGLCFVASGAAMIVGSLARYAREQRATREEVKRMLKMMGGEVE